MIQTKREREKEKHAAINNRLGVQLKKEAVGDSGKAVLKVSQQLIVVLVFLVLRERERERKKLNRAEKVQI